ncbi:MAG: HAMP domain-containing protein [Chloroflexota bacterium]|nr:HAMP domain-containing protein [Dehalococcoidia bacterium]MDW8253926.1 HAMP domain-containing protein [Chloroflexota bacterium]
MKRQVRLFGRREAIALLVGIVLYGVFSWLTSFINLSINAINVSLVLRPAVIVPILMGFFYGPLVGIGVGFFGNAFGDWLIFNAANPALIPRAFTFWHAHLGNGLLGFIPGLYAWLLKPRYRTVGQVVAALMVAALGVAAGMFTLSAFDFWLCRAEAPQPWCRAVGPSFEFVMTARFVPLFLSNTINTLILVPIVMYNAERIDLRDRNWLRSGLLRRLLIAITISAALPTLLLGYFLAQQFSLNQQLAASASGAPSLSTNTLTAQIVLTVLVSLLFAIANAMLVAQAFSRPLLRLTAAAEQMENGQLSETEARQLRATEGADEIGQLAKVFGRMAEEVLQREARLRQQIVELRIEIDEAKKAREVEEITGTDYFQTLQARARELRRGIQRAPAGEAPSPAPSE